MNSAEINRREARRLAVCGVYSMEVTGQTADRTLISLMGVEPEEEFGWPGDNRWPDFAKELVRAVEAHAGDIEREVQAALENWRMDRVSPVERAILKLGCAEIFHFPDIPPRVTINEYIELAKEYANDNAPPFVNGVLDRLAQVKKKPDFTAPRITRAVSAASRVKSVPAEAAAAPAVPQPLAEASPPVAAPRPVPVPRPIPSARMAQAAPPAGTAAEPVPALPAPSVVVEVIPEKPRSGPTLASAGLSLADLLPPAPASPTDSRAAASPTVDLAKVNSRWAREIAEILSAVGGKADLVVLCDRIESRGLLDLGDQWRRTVLNTLERHSAGSPAFDGTPGDIHADLFAHVGPMEWALNNPVTPTKVTP